MSLRTRIAPLVVVLTAVGCSASEVGTPPSKPNTSVSSSSQASPQTSVTSSTGLAAIEACDLLTAQELASLGVPPQGHPNEIAGLRSCDWPTPEGVVSTAINEDLGIDGLNLADASSVTDITIGSYQAKRVVEGSGSGYCDVFFAVGDNANVGVSALYLNDTSRACSTADQAAALVEPKLP